MVSWTPGRSHTSFNLKDLNITGPLGIFEEQCVKWIFTSLIPQRLNHVILEEWFNIVLYRVYDAVWHNFKEVLSCSEATLLKRYSTSSHCVSFISYYIISYIIILCFFCRRHVVSFSLLLSDSSLFHKPVFLCCACSPSQNMSGYLTAIGAWFMMVKSHLSSLCRTGALCLYRYTSLDLSFGISILSLIFH